MKHLKNILFVVILAVLAFPMIQARYPVVGEKRLAGYFRLREKPTVWSFTVKGWFGGSFQDEFQQLVEDHVGFRNSLFRIHNQYDYSLFGISHAQGFIRGKGGILFEEDYIHEYTGKYFIGKQTLNGKLDRLKDLYLRLKKENKDLILVFEPGKASFEPEYIPGHYRPGERSLTNYEFMISGLQARNIPFLDLNRYFLMMKDTSRHPLFPKYGMHWSMYGLKFAIDSLVKYIGSVRNATLPRIAVTKTLFSDKPLGTDNDIGELLNLIWPLPGTPGAFPEMAVDTLSGKKSLKVLVIGDSYYLNIKKTVSDSIFGSEEYWYYNSKVYPDIVDDDNPVYIDKSNLSGKLLQFDVVLLMVSEINLHCLYLGFIDEAYCAFHPGFREDPVSSIENDIRINREWFRFVVAKARSQNRSLERMIRLDAEYMYGIQSKKQ